MLGLLGGIAEYFFGVLAFWFFDVLRTAGTEHTRLSRALARGVGWNEEDVGQLILAIDPLAIAPGNGVAADYARVAAAIVESCPASDESPRAAIEAALLAGFATIEDGRLRRGRVRRLAARLYAVHAHAFTQWHATEW